MIIIKKKGEIIRFGFFLVLMALLAYFVMNRVELFRSSNGQRIDTPVTAQVGRSVKGAEGLMPAPAVQAAPADGHDFFAESRLERDQNRSLHESQLTALINNPNVDADSRKAASEELQKAYRYASLENQAEALIRGKGVDDVLVTITETSAMVTVRAAQHGAQQALQVADMVSSITGLRPTAVKVRFQE